MQKDFHYYATYCAAILAGYTHEESLDICYSAQFVDLCSATMIKALDGPVSATTTQLQLEMMEANTDPIGLQNITRIWASFHFLPRDLYAIPRTTRHCSNRYLIKYRLICGPNGKLVKRTVELAKGKSLQAVGVAMHVLADTWAHQHFAGTPSLVINNTNYHFYEIVPGESGETERLIRFRHNPSGVDDIETGNYINSLHQSGENAIMNLGHGRAGHLPDYSFAKYKYMPAWGEYEEIIKDNPSDYMHAFCQMIYAMKFLRGDYSEFELEKYEDLDSLNISKSDQDSDLRSRIQSILTKRQLDSCEDWKALGEELSGSPIVDFDEEKYFSQYIHAAEDKKNDTVLGKFFLAALDQKSMVTSEIFNSGNILAGFAFNYNETGFRGIKDFHILVEARKRLKRGKNGKDSKS